MANEERVYFVIDAKSFYASVECAERGLDPMTTRLVVADATRTEKTICLAVSPALKKLGVKNRCRLFEVPKDLNAIVARPQMKKYIQYAAKIYGIYLKYISKDDIHAYSIDEFIIDVTTYLKLYKVRAREFAEKLMDEVYENCHIPLTCGIGTNMYLAKVALGITAKHSKGRVAWLNEEKFNRTLANHRPLTDFWGLSRGISSHLARLGIYDMEGILDCDPELLYKEFGVNAELLIDHARGYEPVTMKDVKNYERKSRSFSSGQVFGCGKTKKQARLIFMEMIENLSISLAKERQVTDLVALSARLESGEPIHGSIRLSNRTSLPKYMRNDALTLFDSIVPYDELITGLYVGFGDVTDESKEYYDLFTDMSEVEKDKAVRESMLDISGKYGKNSVLLAHDFSEDATQRERNEMIGGHYGGKE